MNGTITLNRNKGSFSMEQSLVELVRGGYVEREEVLLCAIHPDDLDLRLWTEGLT